jgi:hypothetical protein
MEQNLSIKTSIVKPWKEGLGGDGTLVEDY